MSDPNFPPPPGGNQPPPPPPGGNPPPPPGPPGGMAPSPPAAPGGYQQPQAPGGYQQPGMPPPPSAGGFQVYQPGTGGRVIPELGLRQGEPWQRLVARIIDVIILAVPGFILAATLLTVSFNDCFRGSLDDCSVSAVDYALYGIIMTVISGAYYVGFTAFLGSTPGKMVFGLKVVKQDGSPVDLQTAVMRWAIDGAGNAVAILPLGAGRVLSSVVLLGVSIWGLVLLFSDPRQEDLYDKVGKTYVVLK